MYTWLYKGVHVCQSMCRCVLPGTLVPSATIEMAVTESLRLMVQPKWLATSPMSAVKNPIPSMDTTKHDHPPCRSVKGVSGCAGCLASCLLKGLYYNVPAVYSGKEGS